MEDKKIETAKETDGNFPKTQKLQQKLEKQLASPNQRELPKIKIRKDSSELVVITKAKDFVKYIINATGKIPKSYRYTLTSKIQNLSLELIEMLIRANDIFIKPKDINAMNLRAELQSKAQTNIKVLQFFVGLAVEEGAMLLKQFENISRQGTEVSVLITKWKESDKRRFIG